MKSTRQSANTPHILITLADVLSAAGDVERAIIAWAAESDSTSSGEIGPTFSTSGPGSGWSRQHDATDYARRAIEGGALYYVDEHDGRMTIAESVSDDDGGENGDCPDDVRMSEWTPQSVVRVECPDLADAAAHPVVVANMARSVIDSHGACSDCPAWAALVTQMQDIGAAVADIDATAIAKAEGGAE